MKTSPQTVQTLFAALSETLRLTWASGNKGAQRGLSATASRVGGARAKCLNMISPSAVQVIGHTEMTLVSQRLADKRTETYQKLFGASALVLLADGLAPTPTLCAAAHACKVALLTSPLPAEQVLSHLRDYLNETLAERTTVHGVLMDVFDLGVLLTGDSHIGKSELALELVARGHRLVADDAPELARIMPNTLQARCPPMLQDLLEVRSLGVLNIRAMYGDNAIKDKKNLHLIIELRHAALQATDVTDLHGTLSERELLGVNVPCILIHAGPNRNLAVLVEAAARKQQLRHSGYDAGDDLAQRQRHLIEARRP